MEQNFTKKKSLKKKKDHKCHEVNKIGQLYLHKSYGSFQVHFIVQAQTIKIIFFWAKLPSIFDNVLLIAPSLVEF